VYLVGSRVSILQLLQLISLIDSACVRRTDTHVNQIRIGLQAMSEDTNISGGLATHRDYDLVAVTVGIGRRSQIVRQSIIHVATSDISDKAGCGMPTAFTGSVQTRMLGVHDGVGLRELIEDRGDNARFGHGQNLAVFVVVASGDHICNPLFDERLGDVDVFMLAAFD